MLKKLIFISLLLSLISCSSEESKAEKYMNNCVKDVKKNWYDKKKPKSEQEPYNESKAATTCQLFKMKFPDLFLYYKGEIITRIK